LYFPLQHISLYRADGAAGQCLHFAMLRGLREQEVAKAEEVARILKGVNLSIPVIFLSGEARNALKEHREMLHRAHFTDGGLTAVYYAPRLCQIPEGAEVGTCRDA
jgi:hypothetical protein